MAHHALVKIIFGEYSGRFPAPQLGPPANTPLPKTHESVAFEARDHQHGVFGEAEIEIPLVPEARETPGGAVPAQRLLGAREVEIYNPPCPLVESNTPLPQSIQDSARGRLVLARPTALPTASDHRDPLSVSAGRQLVGDRVGVYESTGQYLGSATSGLDDPGTVSGAQHDRRSRGQFRRLDLGRRVTEVEAPRFRAPALSDAVVGLGVGGRLLDGGYGY